MQILGEDLEILKSQYKDQQNTLQKRESRVRSALVLQNREK